MLCKLIVAVGVLGFLLPAAARGQQTTNNFGTSRSGSTTSGLFGSRSLGGNLQPGGNSLFGGSGTRGSGIGSSATTQNFQAGTITGSERFINQNRDATRSFVGVDASEVRGVGTVGGGQQQGLQGLQNAFNQFRQFNQLQQFQNAGAGQNARTPVRIGLSLGFTPPAAVPTRVSAAAAQRLTRLPGVEFVGTPQVAMDGRTAVVRGTVATERDRELVSRLLLLEPGISSVQNELIVAPASAGRGSPLLGPQAAASPAPVAAPPRS